MEKIENESDFWSYTKYKFFNIVLSLSLETWSPDKLQKVHK